MIWLYTIIITIIVIATIGIIFINQYNKFQDLLIRLNEASTSIETILSKRFDLLNKSIKVIKKNIDHQEEVLPKISKSRSQKLNIFELDNILKDSIEEFQLYGENYDKLKDNKDYTKIEINIMESESEIVALKKYYDDIADKYNSLRKKFPANIVAYVYKYKEKNKFDIK